MLALWLGVAQAHVPIIRVMGAEEDWCGFLNGTSTSGGELIYPGDVVLLRPGLYGPCAFTAGVTDNDTEFTVIQAQDPDDPPVFVHDGSSEAVLDVTGVQFMFFDLRFQGVPEGAVGLRLTDVDAAWIRSSDFLDNDGSAFQVRGDVDDLWILDNRWDGGAGRALDLGCAGCEQRVRVRDNLLVAAGTGLLARPGVVLDAVDNVFSGGDAGIDVSGGPATSILTANLLVDTAEALTVRGGPTLVRSNIVAEGSVVVADGGAVFEDIRILGNTFWGGPVDLGDFDGPGFEVVDNAATNALPEGNVLCEGGCFVDPAAGDFYPADDGPLRGAGQGTTDDALYEDFCGQVRADPPTAGALEHLGSTSRPRTTVSTRHRRSTWTTHSRRQGWSPGSRAAARRAPKVRPRERC